MQDPILKFSDVSFSYDSENSDLTAVSNLSFEIEKGSFVAVLGHNGSGKSTLAKLCNGLIKPNDGTVTVCGIDTAAPDRELDIRKKVGLVFQNPDNQFVATIVEEDVAFGLENLGIEYDEMHKRVDYALRAVGMFDYKESAPHNLSGGQKQRIAIAGIIAMQPDCIVLDEPTSMLDPIGRHDVINALISLNKDLGITVVLITHFMEEAVLADRVIVMNKGDITLDGTPDKVFSNVEYIKSIGLEVPAAKELLYELNLRGIDITDSVLCEDECAELISELIKGVRK